MQPACDGVRYLVMVQGGVANLVDGPLLRADVEIAHVTEPGISQSRSAVIDHCATPVLLFMDDDVTIDLAGVQALADYLAARPELTVVSGVIERTDRRKISTASRMTRWNTGRAMTPEMMVRVEDIRKSGVRFDSDFGLKGKYPIGDEYIFLTDLQKAGCRGVLVPIVLGSHPDTSTGDNWDDPVLRHARQAVLRRVFGAWAPLIRFGFGVKHRNRLGGWSAAIRFGFGL